ncbi:MAG TPA: hypothetical protein VLI04_04505 [Nocardioidaceae bacterium]|nr:hypothetical protein [Nocardioidaceae bacterium]
MSGAVQVQADVLTNKKVGAFQHLTLLAPGVAEGFRPGTLLAVTVGGPLSERQARRTLPIFRARASAYGGTVEVVFEPTEPGESWLAAVQPSTRLDVLGPLGRPFALPKEPVPCVLVGYDAAAAPLLALAEKLRERRCDVHMLLGAASEARVFGALDARRSATSVTVLTDDGSLGSTGSVLTVLPDVLVKRKAAVVYAAGPSKILHGVAVAAEQHGAWSQTAVSVPMPCGTGLCSACVVPVTGADGVVRRARACTDGPVFRGDRVCWEPVSA